MFGFDDQGREVLSFVPGTTDPNPLVTFATDDALAGVAQTLRRYHDVTARFEILPNAPWYFQIGAPTTGEVVCHNDIAPWNTVVQDGRISAFIDWDFAAPGPRIWDVAHAIWRFVPLYEDTQFGTVRDQAQRLWLFCEAYGLEDRSDIVDIILRRQQVLFESIMQWANNGEPAFVWMRDEGHAQMIARDMAYLRQARAHLV